MADSKEPSLDRSAMMTQGVEQARGAVENYLKFFQNGMSATPWSSTELNRKLVDCTQRNLDTVFAHAQSLSKAKDLQDVVRIQTEFFQTQLRSLAEQAKDIGELATKAATSAVKRPLKP